MEVSSAATFRLKYGVEWRTLGVTIAAWLAFALFTLFWKDLGWLIVGPVGAYLVCLIGSLQHEAVHGHPTRSALVNEALVFLPVGLLFSYRRYKMLHLTHHKNDHLTDPDLDPESAYMEPQSWQGLPRPLKLLFTINNTMLGRFFIGPAISTVIFLKSELRLLASGDRCVAKAWLLHCLGLVGVFSWIGIVCAMPIWQYVMFIAYWGLALTLMRSYAEHRAHEDSNCRTVVVETNAIISLLYLNNNLHMAHHECPALAWYRLPSYYRDNKERLLRDDCGHLIKGYWRLLRDFGLKPIRPVAHPLPDSLKRQEKIELLGKEHI